MNEKEAKVYLYLVEYGISWASEIAKHLWFPKSTVNFLADTLWKNGYLSKSMRANTNYYEADIKLLVSQIEHDKSEKEKFLQEIIPTLVLMNQNVKSKPKIIFFDGEENCKNAYLELLNIKDIFYEFWAHGDLVEAFGEKFMDDFISERIKRWIFCESIGTDGEIERFLQKKDSLQSRSLRIFDQSFGKIGSSISIYDDKVLVLNLSWIYSWVRIENRDFAETMKTIFFICQRK